MFTHISDSDLVERAAQSYYEPFPRDMYADKSGKHHNFAFWNGAIVGGASKLIVRGVDQVSKFILSFTYASNLFSGYIGCR